MHYKSGDELLHRPTDQSVLWCDYMISEQLTGCDGGFFRNYTWSTDAKIRSQGLLMVVFATLKINSAGM